MNCNRVPARLRIETPRNCNNWRLSSMLDLQIWEIVLVVAAWFLLRGDVDCLA